MSPEEAEDLVAPFAALLGPQVGAVTMSMLMMIDSAMQGECRDCPCDVCISVRGAGAGIENLFGL